MLLKPSAPPCSKSSGAVGGGGGMHLPNMPALLQEYNQLRPVAEQFALYMAAQKEVGLRDACHAHVQPLAPAA